MTLVLVCGIIKETKGNEMKVIKITKLQHGGFIVEVVVKGTTVRTFECATLEETKSIE